MDGFQRKLAKPKVRKEPVTRDVMQSQVESLGPNPSLLDGRLVAACLLAYSAFFRYDKLSKFRCCDVSFHADGMSLHIVSSKTDQYQQGDSVLVAHLGSRACPVAMLDWYFLMAKLSLTSKLWLFRGVVVPWCGIVTKSGERLCANGFLGYTRMRELFPNKLSKLGFEPKQFGLHSLRSGGCHSCSQH